MKRVLMPLPRFGFDPTEAAVPWLYLHRAGHRVLFTTPDGAPAKVDARMVTGEGLGVFKSMLRADENGRRAFAELEASEAFLHPIAYEAVTGESYDALLLPGGHDKGMRDYLGSAIIQRIAAEALLSDRPVAAICHGTLVAGRAISPNTQRSALFGRRTTGLLRVQELFAYNLTRAWVGDYYRTYPELDRPGHTVTMCDELISYLEDPAHFVRGPGWPIPSRRDSPENTNLGFTFREGNYLSARWPGDAHRFASEFLTMLS